MTALLTYLLQSGDIRGAVVSEMPGDGSLRPRPFVATDACQVLKAAGSKYCPVAVDAALPAPGARERAKLAIVGLPCHVHSLRNAQATGTGWRDGIALVIGLFCDRTMAFGAIDYLIEHSGVRRSETADFRFRRKTAGRWPGDGYVRTYSGEEHTVANRHRQACKDVFTPSRCRLCFDKANVLSDLAVGDAWGVRQHEDGYSVVLARTRQGLHMLCAAADAGVLHLEAVPTERILRGQAIDKRKRDYWAFTAAWRAMGGPVPEFGIPLCAVASPARADVRRAGAVLRVARQMGSSPSPQAALAIARRELRARALRASLSPRRAVHCAARIYRWVCALGR